nr:GH3 auxin-responsive promoter family protein [Paraflavitalea speifideiaquila]
MYNASEGFFAAQDIPGEEGMLLFVDHGVFMEFMPIEEYGKAQPETIGLAEVALGKNYALVISTNGGLWRYLVGDTIQFTSLNPFRIKVSGRLKHYINAFGEEVIVDNTDRAVAIASERTGAIVNDYTAAPIYFSDHGNGAHEWLVEFEKEPDNIDTFTATLDAALKAINSDYEAKRHKDMALRMPLLRSLQKASLIPGSKAKVNWAGSTKCPVYAMTVNTSKK